MKQGLATFRKVALVSFCAALLGLSSLFSSSTGWGQGLQFEITPELLEQARRVQEGAGTVLDLPSPVDQARQSVSEMGRFPGGAGLVPLEPLPPSLLEEDYSARSGESLEQYGYDVFRTAFVSSESFYGAVGESYRLGIGDEVVVTFIGQIERTVRTRVDREGRIILPEMPPISAAGRTFGDFRRDLEAQTAASLLGTDVFVSLGAVRAVKVMVMGEVMHPGVYQLTGMSTLFDALVMAGGLRKTGSLRRIQIVRDDTIFWLDAYDLLFTGFIDRDVTVSDGDRIVVPTIGPTVAVVGRVKRPAIYELVEGAPLPSLGRVLEYAGGTLRPSGNRFLHIAADETGRETVHERSDLGSVAAGGGDLLIVELSQNIQLGYVTLEGHVRVPGRRSIQFASSVHQLVPDKGILDQNPYLPFAVLERTDELTQARRFYPISLQAVLAGQIDIPLQHDDILIVLSRDDIRYLSSADVQAVLVAEIPPSFLVDLREEKILTEELEELQPVSVETLTRQFVAGARARLPAQGSAEAEAALDAITTEGAPGAFDELTPEVIVPPAEVCEGLAAVAAIISGEGIGRFANALRAVFTELDIVLKAAPCPDIYDRHRDLLPFLLEHVVAINGEVRLPGVYPVSQGTPLSSLVAIAGGLTREVDLTKVELSRFTVDSQKGTAQVERSLLDLAGANFNAAYVNPGDVVRFNPVFTDRDEGPVRLVGEFVRPGLYDIRRGERLSEVIARAGGLTPQAYAYGAVFTRESAREREKEGFERAARELESSFTAALVSPRLAQRVEGAAGAVASLVATLRTIEPLGRVVIEADPTVLQVRPELDTILQPGDTLTMPKRSNTVSVAGEVLNPGTLSFQAGMDADDYIEMTGGFQETADEDRTFILYPNGVAERLEVSFWNYSQVQIPPGSVIVVPVEPARLDAFDFLQLTSNVAQIIGSLAITGASLAVIAD